MKSRHSYIHVFIILQNYDLKFTLKDKSKCSSIPVPIRDKDLDGHLSTIVRW